METDEPRSLRFRSDVMRIGYAVQNCQEKPPSSRDEWRNLMDRMEDENGNRDHLTFSRRCNATFGEVSDLLNSEAVFANDRDRLDFCKLLLTEFTNFGKQFDLRTMS